jgi:hypothetical protein
MSWQRCERIRRTAGSPKSAGVVGWHLVRPELGVRRVSLASDERRQVAFRELAQQ